MSLLTPFLSLSSTPLYPSISFPPSSSYSFSSTRLKTVSAGVHSTFGHTPRVYAPVVSQKKSNVPVKASTDGQEAVAEDGDGDSEDKEEKTPLQNIPLESKLQLKLEQKMKMKIAKKIRLRRKRLVRKRMMRKKGRWPPSKMKKLKNV